MWNYLEKLDRVATGYVSRMSTTELSIAVAVVVLIGFVCMQGYGSRNRL